MGNNKYLWAWVIGALLLGALFSYWALPREVIKEVPGASVNVPGPVQYVNQTVEVKVPGDISLYADQAKADVFDRLSDNSDFLTCGGHEYDSGDITVTKYTKYGYIWFDLDNKYQAGFTGRFSFNDGSNNHSCHETRTYLVTYQDNHNPVVELV